MIIRILQFVTLLSLTFLSCKSTKYTLDKLPENTITIGDGGGFAGIETGYLLLENGQIYKYDFPGDTVQLKSIKPAQAKDYYEKFKGLRLHRLDIQHPGNMYYFIKFTDPEVEHAITWGAAGYNLRSDILAFYKSVRGEVQERKEIVVAKTDEKRKIKKKEKEEEEVTGW